MGCAALGDKADAVRLLQQAFGEGSAFGVGMHCDPELRPLWDYEPFNEFLKPNG